MHAELCVMHVICDHMICWVQVILTGIMSDSTSQGFP